MRWHKPNLRSIYGLLGHTPPSSAPSTERRVETLRLAMLEAMGRNRLDTQHLYLVGRIRYAADAPALWHIRSDMMTVLAAALGETEAWTIMDGLSELFRGLLPEGLTASHVRRRSR